MQSIKVVIVEDELVIAMDLQGILAARNYEVSAIAKSYDKGVESIEQHTPDIVLLDIVIKGQKDGVDLAATIRDRFKIPFIFITSHSDPSTLDRAKLVNPNGYLLKPFNDDDVYVAIEMALSNFNDKESTRKEDDSFPLNNSLFIRQKNLTIKLDFDEIKYVQADGNYSKIITGQKQHTLRSTLKEIESKLPSSQFFRAHKSYLINLSFMTAMNNESVFMEDFEIPLSRTQYQDLINKVNKL